MADPELMDSLATAVGFFTAERAGADPVALFADVSAQTWARGMRLLAELALMKLGEVGVDVDEFLSECGRLAARLEMEGR